MAKTIQHINFWWLMEPANTEHQQRIVKSMEALRAIPGVKQVLVGPSAAITWPGPDTSFDLGMIVTFESMDAVRAYMPHSLHQDAIKVSVDLSRRVHAFYIET